MGAAPLLRRLAQLVLCDVGARKGAVAASLTFTDAERRSRRSVGPAAASRAMTPWHTHCSTARMASTRKAVVVGTGAGGLSAAAYLAKGGFEVTGLDQADRIGGFLAPLEADGYLFDPGVHYIGQARHGEILDDVLGGLGLNVSSLFVEMDPEGFDVYRFPDFEMRMCRGIERYCDRVAAAFPTERDGLRRFFDVVSHYADASRLLKSYRRPGLTDLPAALKLPSVLRWERATFAEMAEHYVKDPKARALLAAPDGDLALPPSRVAALAGIEVLAHYLGGAFFPRGGSGALRDALVGSAERNGARFRTNANVVEILVQDGTVTGVRLENGERLEADVVVSDVDPTLTFGKLIDPSFVPTKLRRKIEATRPSFSTFTIYLGMKRDLRERGFGAFNVWYYPTWDLDSVYAPLFDGVMPRQYGMFLASSTTKDDSGKLAPHGCSTLQIITLLPWELFSAWAETRPEQRGSEYKHLEESFSERLLATVEERWPGLVGDVAVKRVWTPLNNAEYTRAVHGGIYGPALTPEQIGRRRFQSRTPISGLYLTGSGVYGAGVANCFAAGRDAAALAAGTEAIAPERKGLRRRVEQLLQAH